MITKSCPSRSLRLLHSGAIILVPSLCLFAGKPAEKAAPLVKVAEFRLKEARMGAAAVVHDDSIYVLGGSSFGAITTIEKFDTRTAEVTSVDCELLARRFHSVFEHEGKIFVFGGQGHGLSGEWFERVVEIYDPTTGLVSKGPLMERARSQMGSAMINGKAYFVGGTKKVGTGIAQTNDVEVFDFKEGKWSRGVPMPTPREAQAAVVTGFILVAGGSRRGEGVTAVEMFVPEENAWKVLPSLCRKTAAHSQAFLGEHLFLFGDENERDTVLAYNLHTRKSQVCRIPGYHGTRYSTAVVWRERIYVIGGIVDLRSSSESDLIQVFALNPQYHPVVAN